jgi:hypothetical protein
MSSAGGGPPRRAIVYIDAFNLYYRALKGTSYRWLNIEEMSRRLLHGDQIERIRYFTARILPTPGDPGKAARQDVYLRALAALPSVTITYGRYLSHPVMRPLRNPPVSGSRYVEVLNSEEKGSDVNLATYLLLDAFRAAFDVAAVITNDSDLAEPIRVATQELGKAVGLLSPVQGKDPVNPQLRANATFVKRIRPAVLAASQFPDIMSDVGGTFHKPAKW